MKALLAVCVACSLAGAALAQDQGVSPASTTEVATPAPAAHFGPSTIDRKALMQRFMQGHQHEDDLLWPLIEQGAARGLCKDTRAAIGFRFFDLPHAPERTMGERLATGALTLRDMGTPVGLIGTGVGAAESGYDVVFGNAGDVKIVDQMGLVLGSSVSHLVPDAPAAKAGLHEGDRITAIAGSPVAAGRGAGTASNTALDHASSDALEHSSVVHLDVLRGGQALAVDVAPVRVCAVSIRDMAMAGPLDLDGSDPHQIVVDERLMGDTSSDTERSIVLGHLMGHTLQASGSVSHGGQVAARVAGSAAASRLPLFGGVLALARLGVGPASALAVGAGASANTSGSETAADALSLPLLQAVGIDAKQVLDFWQREKDEPHTWLDRHRVSEDRLAKLRAAVEASSAGSTASPSTAFVDSRVAQ